MELLFQPRDRHHCGCGEKPNGKTKMCRKARLKNGGKPPGYPSPDVDMVRLFGRN